MPIVQGTFVVAGDTLGVGEEKSAESGLNPCAIHLSAGGPLWDACAE